MDKSAMDSSYKADVAKHASQVDASKGFGGKYGVQKDRVDKVSDYHVLLLPCIFLHVLIFIYLPNTSI